MEISTRARRLRSKRRADLPLAASGLRAYRNFILADIKAGQLAPVLEEFNPGDREDIHAVFLGRGGPLPARVRAFVDPNTRQAPPFRARKDSADAAGVLCV